jgi:exodeoxyribonuclease VII small subunit
MVRNVLSIVHRPSSDNIIMAKREQSRETKKTEAAQSFESSLASLEKVVRELERGDLPLEKSLDLFEQGVRLSRECQERLNEAERRIEVLLRDNEGRTLLGAFESEEFPAADDEDESEETDESVF